MPLADPVRITTLMEWARFALEAGRYSEAEARYLEVLDLDWNHPQAFDLLKETRALRTAGLSDWLARANRAVANHDWEKAQALYTAILYEDSTSRSARLGIDMVDRYRRTENLVQAGLDRFILGQYVEAHGYFQQALKINPADSIAALYAQRAEDETVQSSSLADLRSDEAVWGIYLDALKRFRAGDLPGAEQLWKQVLAKYPGNEAVMSNLEQITRRKKNEYSAQEIAP